MCTRASDQQLSEFMDPNFANMTWAFATVKQADVRLIVAMARAAKRRINEVSTQDLESTLSAFVSASCCHDVSLGLVSQWHTKAARGRDRCPHYVRLAARLTGEGCSHYVPS
eukprot:gnl/TRDRNA2_/TRDRNA2_173184_c4_seq4.p1 gnl/TRDRNA2_/TRDRNA2_173184_c4~~gnl/TRDRNA2_/TRDRNA2_173184_c4_seq4.p1  ORF type:complete len:112 (+),score=16.24 gnl/TRDRNA2_/TRDRNA2_173184_c4_seq4:284-619(+)